MSTDNLSPELLEKLKACTTSEELKSLVEAEGFELTDDMLQAVSGGVGDCVEWICNWYDCHENGCGDFKACGDHFCYIDNCPSQTCHSFTCQTKNQ